MLVTNNKIPSESGFFTTLVLAISQRFYYKIDEMFPTLKEHFADIAPDEESHAFSLIKKITFSYCRIRIFNIAKKYTEKIQGTNVRRELNKLIIFNHQ